jgi:flagellar motor switch protein FliM
MCDVEIVSIEEQKYFEFTNSLPSVELFGIIGMEPLFGSALIDISPPIAYGMINRVLGGSAVYENTSPNFTEIEMVIMEKILRQMLVLLDEAWYKIVPIDSSLERIETNPQFAQIVSANETIVIITMNVKINDLDGFIHFCIPHMAIKPIAKQLTVRYSNKQEGKELDVNSKEIGGILRKTQLNLRATFGTTYTTVKDCINLQVGDVLMIDHSIEKPVNLYVEHIPKFKGKLGLRNNKYAIKITDIDFKEDGEDEWDIISGGN